MGALAHWYLFMFMISIALENSIEIKVSGDKVLFGHYHDILDGIERSV